MTDDRVSSELHPRAGATTSHPAPAAPGLDASFVEAIKRWEELPHNRDGNDKTWVERLCRSAREHLDQAEQIGR